jgi:hypothetical protein
MPSNPFWNSMLKGLGPKAWHFTKHHGGSIGSKIVRFWKNQMSRF